MSGQRPRAPRRERRTVVRSQVDPKLVERRRAVRAAQARRRRRTLAGIGAVALAVVVGVGVVLSPLLDVDRVDVLGLEQLDAVDVVDASGVTTGEPLVAVDLGEVRQAVAAMPWAASATVVRHWPGTIEIRVVEEQPLATVEHARGHLRVSRSGRVLSTRPGGSDPVVVVVDGALTHAPGERVDGELRRLVGLVGAMDASVWEMAESFHLGDDAQVVVDLGNGATARLGRLEGAPAKLLALETVLARVELACLGVVDVREPARATVGRVDGCEPPPPTTSATDDTADDTADGSSPSTPGSTGTGADT